jgi:hypothetical protein
LSYKTNSFGLVIWVSKSPRQFPDFDLKPKRAMICRLHSKTDEMMKTTWGTHHDLAAYFTWKQAGIEFFLCCQAPSHAAGRFSFFLGLEFIFARTLLSIRFSARVQVSAGQWSRSVRRQIFGPDPIICSASIRPLIFAAGLG